MIELTRKSGGTIHVRAGLVNVVHKDDNGFTAVYVADAGIYFVVTESPAEVLAKIAEAEGRT